MRLTVYTDYTLRTLMHLAANPDRLVTIQDIADLHKISKNHLTKVVHQLGLSDLVTTIRGRSGGLKLNKAPKEINIGEVVRTTETDFFMAECFDPNNTNCAYSSACTLKKVLNDATTAYLAVLDKINLDDLVRQNPDTYKATATPTTAKVSDVHVLPSIQTITFLKSEK